ncbi:MAG: amidohydrolase [Deltaproteobacteria bacterium]|jgi:predicted amidohydrolase YtcJ|nr:amidohydrolase [Deltaproteobacteria bacterium]
MVKALKGERAAFAKAAIYHNGSVYTLEPGAFNVKVLATCGQKLAYVGDELEDARAALKALGYKDKPELFDLSGRAVIPGLFDSHTHVLTQGVRLKQLDLYGLGYQESLDAVEKKVKSLDAGIWLHGRGWDQNNFPNRAWPRAKDLDKIAPNNPVVLDRVDKHSVWVNSEALRLAGINGGTKNPPGGEILKDTSGNPEGVLVGKAMFLVFSKMPNLDGLDPMETLLASQKEMLSLGLTTVIDCGVRWGTFKLFKRAWEENKLEFRFRGFLVFDACEKELLAQGPVREPYDDKLSIDGVKLFSDGSLGSQSAWLRQPYSDRPDYLGDHNYEDDELYEVMVKVRDLGYQAAIHVIGDAAVEQAIRVMERVLGASSLARHWRLEHFQVISPWALEKALKLGLIPSIQSVGLMSDLHMVGYRLGAERLKDSYRWKSVLKGGGILINGSDAPIETPNPFHGIYAAVARKDLNGHPQGGFMMEEALTLTEALKSYTLWPAYSSFRDKELGSLKAGKLADFVVLDRDIFKVETIELAHTLPVMTVVGGERVFIRS